MVSKPEQRSTRYTQVSPSYHLFSTVAVVAWSIFIIGTVMTFELTNRAMWNFDRVAASKPLPWGFIILPTILRTGFDQGHGPITAMHLARLAVGSLDTSWTSANTWMEVFWLADRRWAGPVGLWTIFEAMFSLSWHSLRVPRVSFGFWLFAALSIITLVTPLDLSRGYHGTTADIRRQTTVSSVFMMDVGEVFDPSDTSASGLQNLQIPYGIPIWGRGVPPTVQFRDTMYAEHDERPTPSSGDWFISGNSRRANMQLVGLRVSGGCEYLQANDGTFGSVCAATFGDDPLFIGTPVKLEGYEREITTCTNISINSTLERQTHSTASVLFHIWQPQLPKKDTILRCNATMELGDAAVDGRAMTFSNFISITLSKDFSNWYQFANPLAAIIKGGYVSYEWAVAYRMSEARLNPGSTQDGVDIGWAAETMWSGVLAMSVAVWIQSAKPADLPGVQSLTTTGLRRDDTYACILAALLGIWFIGMFACSAALLRPTWASSLDGYAVARLLQQQPVLAGTSEAWLKELEENEDMLQEFTMHDWRESGS